MNNTANQPKEHFKDVFLHVCMCVHDRQSGSLGSRAHTSVVVWYDENECSQGGVQPLIMYKRQPDVG